MDDGLLNIVLGVLASAISAGLGWFGRRFAWRHALHRKQRFFGLPTDSECLLVVNQEMGTGTPVVARHDVFALLELAALIKECGAHTEIVSHDGTQQGFGQRTEFCIGGPVSNRRMNAHLRSLLPGVREEPSTAPGSPHGAFRIGGKGYEMTPGETEYVLLARVSGGENGRPVFLASGQRPITNQAAVRYLARHHRRLARKHGVDSTFCLLLKVVNSTAYGPDVVELVADVTQEARTAPPVSNATPSTTPSPTP